MTKAVTIWTGPVNASQNGNLAWPGSSVVYITCTGDQTDGGACHELAAKRPLSTVAGDADEVYLAAFSAGGQLIKRWLTSGDPAVARVRGVFLADGTFADWQGADPKSGQPDRTLNQGLIDFVTRAAQDPTYRAVFTASGNAGTTGAPTGSQVLASIRDASGAAFTASPVPDQGCFVVLGGACVAIPAGAGIAPAGTLWRAGGASLADLGLSITHNDHPTKLARILWDPLFVHPPVDTGIGGWSRLWVALGTAAGAALAAAGGYAAWSARRRRQKEL